MHRGAVTLPVIEEGHDRAGSPEKNRIKFRVFRVPILYEYSSTGASASAQLTATSKMTSYMPRNAYNLAIIGCSEKLCAKPLSSASPSLSLRCDFGLRVAAANNFFST